MSAGRHFDRIAAAVMALAVLCAFLMVYFSGKEEALEVFSASVEMPYESLFDQFDIMKIEIEIEEEDWADILANPLAEEYKACDVKVNGTTYANVAIRTKGNTSLWQIRCNQKRKGKAQSRRNKRHRQEIFVS